LGCGWQRRQRAKAQRSNKGLGQLTFLKMAIHERVSCF
jgi:hypothetical protein